MIMRSGRDVIHCIGDSHANLFSGVPFVQPSWPEPHEDLISLFRTYRLGPVLAYNLSRSGTRTRGREKLFAVLNTIPIGSRVLFCFGEIDCRAHLLKQAEKQNRGTEDVVNECVDRYFSVIKEVSQMGYGVLVWHVPPSTRFIVKGGEYPTYGTCLERNRVVHQFNRRLSELIEENSLKAISIFDRLVDRDGLTKIEYFRDSIHLSQKVMPFVIEEIRHKIGRRELLNLDFIGIGAVRSGTTWLTECLREHPEIYLPSRKEICFFDFEKKRSNYSKGWERYSSFFEKAPKGAVRGEFTTHYMFFPESCGLIKRHFPNVKLIACLRRPEDTVYSFYWWKKANFESGDLAETFEGELEKDDQYIKRGFYYKQLKRFYDVFPREKIKIVLFDDIKERPQEVLKDVYGFLGVGQNFAPSVLTRRVNRAKKVRFKLLADLVNLPMKALRALGLGFLVRELISNPSLSNLYGKVNKKPFDYPSMREETRLRLKRLFRKDVEKLEKLIERDLSSWK